MTQIKKAFQVQNLYHTMPHLLQDL